MGWAGESAIARPLQIFAHSPPPPRQLTKLRHSDSDFRLVMSEFYVYVHLVIFLSTGILELNISKMLKVHLTHFFIKELKKE